MKKDDISLSILDAKEVKKLQEKKEKIQRVMEVIRENGLDKDKEFITEINNLIE
jgi:hypothetical protein